MRVKMNLDLARHELSSSLVVIAPDQYKGDNGFFLFVYAANKPTERLSL